MKLAVLLLVMTLFLFACNQNKLEGTFIYTEIPKERKKEEGLFSWGVELGKEIACSSIGVITFKNEKCYYSVSMFGIKQDMKVDYHIDNGIIYINSDMFNQNGVGLFELVDNNTLTY